MIVHNHTMCRFGFTRWNSVAFRYCLMLMFFVSTVAHAGRGDKTGTAAATELLIPVGARSIGLGGACLATAGGVEAIQWNPAGLATTTFATTAMVSHMTYLADIAVDYAAISTTLGEIASLGLSVKSLAVGDIPITTEDHPDGTGETTSPTMLVIGGTLSRRISDRIAVGITSNFIYEKMAKVATSGVSFNAGLKYAGLGGIEGLMFGVAVRNLGPKMQYDGDGLVRLARVEDATRDSAPIKISAEASELPSTIDIGLGYRHDVTGSDYMIVSSTFQNNNLSDDEYRFGGEFVVQNSVSFRVGYVASSASGDQQYIYGPSAGIGIHTSLQNVDIMADYGYRSVRYFSGNHAFSLTLGF